MNSDASEQPPQQPVALITGGSSGIGLATAQCLAQQGFRIAICGRNRQRLEAAQQSIDADCLILEIDLNSPSQTVELVDSTLERYGRVDVLVNNAASAPLAPFEDISDDVFEQSINTNIRSVFYLTQHVWRVMKQQGRGVVVNISSQAAVDPFPGFSLYGASKAWLDLMTLALAAEGQPLGIRVYSIRPGAVETPMLRGLFPDFPADECVQPEQIAQAIWNCINQPEEFESGQAYSITNQRTDS